MLQRPWLTPLVVAFACIANGWLALAKILPSLLPGSPPGHQALYTAGEAPVPVGWTVRLNDMPLGWAIARAHRDAEGRMIVDSRLQLVRLPVEDISPPWMAVIMRQVMPKGGDLSVDASNRITIDAAGDLRSFRSVVAVPGLAERLVLDGTVDGGSVRIRARAGEVRYETTRHLPDRMMISDEFSPMASIPGLHEGRRWTVPVYSPLRTGRAQLEILHAEVEAERSIYWDHHLVRVHPVVYREDPSSHHEPRCRLWVDRTGRVLRQESALLGSRLTFERKTDEAAALLAAGLATDAADALPDAVGEEPNP